MLIYITHNCILCYECANTVLENTVASCVCHECTETICYNNCDNFVAYDISRHDVSGTTSLICFGEN